MTDADHIRRWAVAWCKQHQVADCWTTMPNETSKHIILWVRQWKRDHGIRPSFHVSPPAPERKGKYGGYLAD